MDDEDDDFGDLYADVEGEASSAMNAAPQCSQIQCVNDELDTQDDDNDKACVDIDTEEDDDDDDDLDIVLNSGDDSVRPAEGFRIARNNTNLPSRQLEDEDDDNLDTEESMGGKTVDNSHSLYKYLRSQSTAYGSDIKGTECMTAAHYWQQIGSRSIGPQNAERFSLPRARSILDVNIDIFALKPWRHPGVDITDYFNFGFNEESWKVYCNQVDEYRHRGPVSSGTPPSEPAQSTEVDTSKGQAIQVEESIYERQSSMDITCQLDRDTDVIEITIVDQDDKCVPEASNHGDVSGDDDVTDHLSFSSASEDDTIEGNYIKEDLEIHQVVTDETIRNLNDSKESNLVEELTESFEDDRCLTELTRSMKPDYHRSEDSMKSDGKRRLYENIYHSRMLGDKRKHGDRTLHERCNNPAYNNRTHKDFNLKTHQDRSYTELTSSMNRGYRHPKADGKRRHDENRYHTRKYGDGVYHERCNNHVHKDLNTKTHHENDDIISGRTVDKRKYGEQRYHARHSSGYFPRSDDPYNEENMLYSKSEISSGERFYGYEDWDTKRFGSNRGRSISRFSEDDEYFCGQRRYNEDKRMMVGDWYHYEKGLKKGEKLLLRNKGEFQFGPRCFDGENFEPFMYYDQKSDDFEYTRWEFGRNKRRVCSLSSELNDPPSSEESHVMISKGSLYRRHGSYGGQSFDSFDTEKHITDEIMFRREDSRFCGYGNSFPLEKVSRRSKRFVSDRVKELIDDRYVVGSQLVDHGSGYVEELTDGQPANRCRYYRQKNEVFSFQRLPLSSRNSKSVVGEVKSTEKHKKPKKINFNTHLKDKVARTDESRAIGEAQILTEEVKVGRGHVNEPGNENGKSGVDNTRILEAMAKMEKRRARFNDPVTITRKSSDSSNKLAVGDSAQETASVKQERPVRKRRWGGS